MSPQADYVVSNGTGAATRSDINGQLSAIVSQNSGATAPATTYAYMTWADTTAGVMKMRNGANNAWITLYQLDGEWSTIAFENGSAAAPSIYFKDSGTDTGIYSPGTDQVAISTGGTGRLFIDASGRLLAGTSTARTNFFGTTLSSLTQIEGTGGSNARGSISVLNNDVSNNPPYVLLGRSGAATLGSNAAVVSGSRLGTVSFHGADGTSFIEAATVAGEVDGTPGSNDMPGRLVFSTTADGAASPTERLRITSTGAVGIGTSAPTNYGAGVNNISINGSAGGISDFYFNGTRQGWIGTLASNQMVVDTAGAAIPLTLRTNGNAALTIDTSQRVGIGTTSPSNALHVNSGATGTSALLESTGSGCYLNFKTSSGSGVYVGALSTSFFVETNATERARIDFSGRLLVGTSSARGNFYNTTTTAAAQIEGTTGDTASLAIIADRSGSPSRLILASSGGSTIGSNTIVSSGNGAGSISFQASDGTEFIQVAEINADIDGTPGANDMPGRLVFSTTADGASSPTERVRIDNNGDTYFGSTTKTGNGTCIEKSSNGGRIYIGRSTSDTVAEFHRSGTRVGQINVDTTSTAYITSSDYRLKENVTVVTDGIARLQQLKPSRFNFIINPDRTVDGFIAHEAQAVVPECATGTKDAVDADGNPIYQGIDQSKLVPLLTAALQEAIAKIETLEARLTAAGIE
jgi:hypothetical protein